MENSLFYRSVLFISFYVGVLRDGNPVAGL